MRMEDAKEEVTKKTAIFIIGDYDSGKTSLIRALTGSGGKKSKSKGDPRKWYVRTLNGRKILALVLWSALQEDPRIQDVDPENIVEKLEELYGTDFELIICPLELSVRGILHKFTEYLDVFISSGFDVKVSAIKNSWQGVSANVTPVQVYALKNNLKCIVLDIGNSDEHLESRKIRDNLYPQ